MAAVRSQQEHAANGGWSTEGAREPNGRAKRCYLAVRPTEGLGASAFEDGCGCFECGGGLLKFLN